MTLIIEIILWFAALNFSSFLLSKLEKRYVEKNEDTYETFSIKSLALFKKVRLSLYLFASFEAVHMTEKHNVSLILIGVLLVIAGMFFRIAAITSLGKLWSYKIRIYKNHSIVKTGIYKYFKHPAYLGNMHITGITLLIGSAMSSVLSLIFIACFYIARTKIENKLLENMGSHLC